MGTSLDKAVRRLNIVWCDGLLIIMSNLISEICTVEISVGIVFGICVDCLVKD